MDFGDKNEKQSNRIVIAPVSGRSRSDAELSSTSAGDVIIVKTRSCHTQLSLGQAQGSGESMVGEELSLHYTKSSSSSAESKKFEWIDPEQSGGGSNKRPSVVVFNILEETVSHSTPVLHTAGISRDGQRNSIFSCLSDISFNSFTYSWNYKRMLSLVLILLAIFFIYIFIVLIFFSPAAKTSHLPLENIFF